MKHKVIFDFKNNIHAVIRKDGIKFFVGDLIKYKDKICMVDTFYTYYQRKDLRVFVTTNCSKQIIDIQLIETI